MLTFLQKLKKFAIGTLILGCLALVVTSIIGSLFFNLDPINVFTWFAVAFIVYFVVLFVIAILCFIAWYFSPTILVLILAIALILGTCFVFVKMTPTLDIGKLLEDNKITSLLGFLEKPGEDYSEELAEFQASIDASIPAEKEIDTTFTSERGNLSGSYTVTYDDGVTYIEYTYDAFKSETDNETRTYKGEAEIVEGGSIDDAKINDNAFKQAMSLNIKLENDKLKNISIVSDSITAQVKADDTGCVLGVVIDANVDLVISNSRDGITTVNISYTSAEGTVNITVVYNYTVA